MSDEKYCFVKTEQEAYERLVLPIAVFQLVCDKVVTLMVSDGLCQFIGMSRENLLLHFDQNMFGNVHPDDVEMLAEVGYHFARGAGEYDVTYRTKLYGKDEYRYVHAIGKMQSVGSNSEVAFITYADLTGAEYKLVSVAKELHNSKLKFLDENLGSMVVVDQEDKRLLYFNQSVCQMLLPKGNYDSGMSFQEYFYPDVVEGIRGLFDAVDRGPRVLIEPYSKREIEVNVVSSTWQNEPVYVVYFYEASMDNLVSAVDTDLRHRRMNFNQMMFFGSPQLPREGERGECQYRVWNLTRNESVFGGDINLLSDDYFQNMINQYTNEGDRDFLTLCARKNLLLLFETDNYPRFRKIRIQTQKGQVYLALDFIMMRSPDSEDVYLKVCEEDVTEREVLRKVINKTVEQDFQYLAYLDILADRCWIIRSDSGQTKEERRCVRLSEYVQTTTFLKNLSFVLGKKFDTVNDMVEYLTRECEENKSFTEVCQISDRSIKKIFVEMMDKENKLFYIRCTDVTSLLQEQRTRQNELEHIKNEVIIANQHLKEAVQKEHEKVESVLVQTILSVSNALDARDKYTSFHSQRVAKYAAEIARCLSWENKRVQNLYNIALVHDIGKIGIPDELLLKQKALTDEEYELIKDHVTIGGNILKDFTAIDKVSDGALYHHERYDGTGYAMGLKGDEIPIEARVIGIADAVDAMNSTRPYRERQSVDYILEELEKGRATQFDPSLVDIMCGLIERGMLETEE